MAQKSITVPIALSSTNTATLTLPWFVQKTEYSPAQATFKPLVNGEEAFGAVYDAIEQARTSVDIICWGFQPSMHFKRGAGGRNGLPIGSLLEKKGKEGVKVRLLCWADSAHMAALQENNMPGNNLATGVKPVLPDSMVGNNILRDYQEKYQRTFDTKWYERANLNNVTRKKILSPIPAMNVVHAGAYVAGHVANKILGTEKFNNIEFATRDFNLPNRAEITWRTYFFHPGSSRDMLTRSANALAMGAFEPTHHQKMVLIDYDTPETAIGFVMGHNMLDTYWDKDNHSVQRMEPMMGRNGLHPRQDISSRVSGPILKNLNENFTQAWDDATGQHLGKKREMYWQRLTLGCEGDTPVMAQMVRTQSQKKRQDIAAMYLQAVNNATQFIYIENQYFRFQKLADKIKSAAQKQVQGGRDPGKHGPIHLFVITNSNDEGIGAGTVNTYHMLNTLGRTDVLPGVALAERDDAAIAQEAQARQEISGAQETLRYVDNDGIRQKLADAEQRLAQAQQQQRDYPKQKKSPEQYIAPQEVPGLKVHICTLVAPDSPPGNWDYVYIHAKLMIVDDVFTTLGSANINLRSMEADSELNIFHENADATQPLRRRLWKIHTKPNSSLSLDDMSSIFEDAISDRAITAFNAWENIINRNTVHKDNNLPPIASLIGFMRTSDYRSYAD